MVLETSPDHWTLTVTPVAARPGAVFIPVSTPGIGSVGHLFRADGGAVLPLLPIYRDSLPGLGDVLGDVSQALRSLRAEAVT